MRVDKVVARGAPVRGVGREKAGAMGCLRAAQRGKGWDKGPEGTRSMSFEMLSCMCASFRRITLGASGDRTCLPI